MEEDGDWGELATPMDACREYALNFGAENQERAWVLTDFDVWMPNPFYRGPPVPHPEEERYDDLDDLEPPHPDAVPRAAQEAVEDVPF